jgi:hypothetical protein
MSNKVIVSQNWDYFPVPVLTMEEFSMYFGLGWDHILSRDALDHILFIIALAVIYRLGDWKQVLVLVTAFTIGHFLTLLLSVTDVVRADEAWVEFLIPLTILVTAASNLFLRDFRPRSLRLNYLLALCFGLVHGLGYANAIRFVLVDGQSLGKGLFAFNLGLEIGQIIVVLCALTAGEMALRYTRISRRLWVVAISSIVLLLSLNMVIERIPDS